MTYDWLMYSLAKCLVPACKNISLSTFDENGALSEERNYCLDHSPHPHKAKEAIYAYIRAHDTVVGLNASGIPFRDIDFSSKKFYGCNFSHCTFDNMHSKNCVVGMSVYDFATFTDCAVTESMIRFSSFAGCIFSHTLLTGSSLIQSNFNGIKSFESSFDDCDLHRSRFILAQLTKTSFQNCNIKQTWFLQSKRNAVSFKLSNTREAIFEKTGSALFTEAL